MISLSHADVAAYYSVRLPEVPQRGKHWRGRCRIHGGQGYNFTVNPENGLWRCWSSCGRGGDVIALEMALTGVAWRDAVMQIEHIIGRVLLERPANRAEEKLRAERHERERLEVRAAEFFRIAATSMAEQVLAELPEAVPERFVPTQVLLSLRASHGSALLAVYRDFRERKPELTAVLVHAGERAWQRMCTRLARFVAEGAEARHVA